MKNQVEFKILILTGFVFVFSLFPFAYVDGAKFQSGVTITAPTTTPPPAGTCPDTNGDGIPDMTGGVCTSPPGSTAETCGLQIVSGVPINYGQLNPGQESAEQKITIKNEGTLPTGVTIMIKGGNWISDAVGNPTISGPEYTHYWLTSGRPYDATTSLSSNGSELGWIHSGGTLTAFFQFRPMPNVPSGSFHQEVTLDSIC
ncbi:MAG TPA: hypothetical protein VL854_04345 [Nitrososphaeraceae archaeon]|nr:hypothetical protein [Nitrososphaeraceae archaeon]